MKNKIKNTSKILSLILRHNPEKAGIKLDKNGWTNVETLLDKFSAKFYLITQEFLEEVVATDNKNRYSFNQGKTSIRANQGHSVQVDLELSPVTPPEILYHGTVEKFLPPIKETGLQKRNRQHVHLSADTETAMKVGSRRGKPIILKIQSGIMSDDGYKFYLSENNVWLTDEVPAKYINF